MLECKLKKNKKGPGLYVKNAGNTSFSTVENVLNEVKERFDIDFFAIWGMRFKKSLHHRIVIRGGARELWQLLWFGSHLG